MRTYIISRDTVINMFYPTWSVLTEDRTASSFDNSFNMRGDILSCPDAFLRFNSFSAFCISAGCIVLKLNGLIPVIVDTADLIA